MSYLVLARKYRPQTLGDLAGQEAIAKTLINAIEQNRVSHAMMLCGPRGVGKTSTARILAKSLNCSVSPGAHPCGTCESCISIAEGYNMDVIEIDGASNNGVENIRELRENVKFATASAKYKIYIIDEVHMLSKAAFNALLKTLEEPPSHVKFIFATTEINKVPETIRSRTQRFDFKLVSTADITKHLQYLCKAETIAYEDDALYNIALEGRGSIRDALTLLDQAIVYASGTITTETVSAMTGSLTFEKTFTVATSLITGDAGKALELVDSFLITGIDVDQIFNQLIELFRALMIIPDNPAGMAAMFKLNPEQLEMVRRVEWSQESAIYALQLLNKGRQDAPLYPEARIALEMAVIRCARIDNIVALADIVSGKKKIEGAASAPAVRPSVPTIPSVPSLPATPVSPALAAAAPQAPANRAVAPTPPAPTVLKKEATPQKTEKQQEPVPPPIPKKETTEEAPVIAPVASPPAVVEAPSTATPVCDTTDTFASFIATVAQRFPSFAALLENAIREVKGTTHLFIIKNADPFKMERLCARSAKLEMALQQHYGDDATLCLEAYEEKDEPREPAQEKAIPFVAAPRSAPLTKIPDAPAPQAVDLPWDASTPKPLAQPRMAEEKRAEVASDTTGLSSGDLLTKAKNNKDVQALKDAFNCSIMNVTELKKETPCAE